MSIIPNVLTIAGSDSGGGAGIQADIKTISATGSYACSVLTALTAQNTQRVSAIHPVPTDFIADQIDAIFSDIHIHAVKIGMLHNSEIIETIAAKLKQYQPQYIVLDPVMVATSGSLLLQQEAIASLITHLFPLATCITPNLAEAAQLSGLPIANSREQLTELIHFFQRSHFPPTLIKGGHFSQECGNDTLVMNDNIIHFDGVKVNTNNTHGTGCTLSSAIASYLAQGYILTEAITKAKQYLTQALQHADRLKVGQASGPVDHFHFLRSSNN